MGTFEKIIIGLISLVVVTTGFILIGFNDRLNACDAVGGTMVKTAEGWQCFKMVRLEKTT
jgi:glucose uptake protein GlcU